MPKFCVKCEIWADADTHREAAIYALDMMQDKTSQLEMDVASEEEIEAEDGFFSDAAQQVDLGKLSEQERVAAVEKCRERNIH